MRVLKFGGSSVGTPDAVRAAGAIIQRALAQGDHGDHGTQIVVIVSAFAGVTDQLIAVARRAARGEPYDAPLAGLEARHRDAVCALCGEDHSCLDERVRACFRELGDLLRGAALTGELSVRVQDAVMSYGERLSAAIVAAYLAAQGIEAEALDMRPLVCTDARFGSARVDRDVTFRAIQDHFAAHPALQVATGFIGSTATGETTTLGRGGSDYTAALLGAALDADEIEIWTDVDGVLTADPRMVPDAFPLTMLTYEEAMELAHFGAKVIYPPTIQPALQKGIPLRVRNTFATDASGTLIARRRGRSPYPITGLTSISSIALLLVQGSGMIGAAGTAMRLFGALARRHISVILITQASSEHTICVAVDPAAAEAARSAVEEEFALELQTGLLDPVAVRLDCAVIAAVGEGMRERPGIAATLFSALGRRRINVVAIAQGSSELNISVVVAGRDEATALRAVHASFFHPARTEAHVFLAGAGLVGGTLLRQIEERARRLEADSGIHLRLRGVATSRHMLVSGEGEVEPGAWRERLERDGEPSDTAAFVERMLALGLPNTVLVDCTASGVIPGSYAQALRAGAAVVTANKRGLAGPYAHYAEYRCAAKQGRAALRYETAVGAGLPVLAPLADLLATGDTVIAVEGVLSGTLSYLFNSFDGTRPFSAVLRAAQEAGYTEPDPRDDLSGADVTRKLVILARECGQALEPEEVAVEQLLPEPCLRAPSLDAFYDALAEHDAHFERLRAEAEHAGKRLRYLARLRDGHASIALTPVGPEHPAAGLSGSDNIVIFTTARYHEQPLVVRGPGAGAEVTAAGVLADILRAVECSR